MFKQHITKQLAARKEAGLLRRRLVGDTVENNLIVIDGKRYINFSSNDYLAIAQSSNGSSVALNEQNELANSGAMASPLVIGRSNIHQQLEQQLLSWVHAPSHYDCLLFSSGFAANSSVINTLFNDKNGNATLFQDRLNHASLLEGGRQSQGLGHCRQYRFKHNDVAHLSQLLNAKSKTSSPTLVATEGVFSMDGDAPDLQSISQISKKHDAWVMVDDAHGIGTLGQGGSGSLAAQNVSLADIDILVITFGKAIGSQGAAVIADSHTIDYLVNFSREYIYSTHLAPIQAQMTMQNISKIQNESWRQEKLQENISLFRQLMLGSKFELMPSHSPIQPVLIGDEVDSLRIADQLKKAGIWANAMRYPTVAKGQARLRVTLTAGHSKQQITLLAKALNEVKHSKSQSSNIIDVATLLRN
ncbi:MAG: 8-amino-7-oxononanoate synthase [Gammaproteobacteria bacterium]|nr:8-amino-7-oxononanoate synthase [Gammaproteobacteria bacterium]